MSTVNAIIASGVFDPPASPRDSWSLGTVSAVADGIPLILLDGDENPDPSSTTLTPAATTVPVSPGDRVVVLLLGRHRVVMGVVGAAPVRYPLTFPATMSSDSSGFVEVHGGRAYLNVRLRAGAADIPANAVVATIPASVTPPTTPEAATILLGSARTLTTHESYVLQIIGQDIVMLHAIPANRFVQVAPTSWAV